MEPQPHRVLIRHPFHTITLVLVVFALVLSVVLLARVGSASAPAAASAPPQPPPARPTAAGFLTVLHKIGKLQRTVTNQQSVIEEFNDGAVEVRTTVTDPEVDINLATLSDADVTVRRDGIAIVTLSDIDVNLDGKTQQQYRQVGTQAWADIPPEATSRVAGVDQFASQEQAQIITSIKCTAASWVQPIVTERMANSGLPAAVVQAGLSC